MKKLLLSTAMFFMSCNVFGQFSDNFPLTNSFEEFEKFYSIDVGDDGDIDLIVGNKNGIFWLENINGNFERPKRFVDEKYRIENVAPIDLNQDGRLDIIVRDNNFKDGLTWLLNKGNGKFESRQIILPSYASWNALEMIDMNEDGLLDLLISVFSPTPTEYRYKVLYYENQGMLEFGEAQVVADNNGSGTIAVADFNNDGHKDVLSSSYYDNEIAWYENNGKENFSTKHIVSTEVNNPMQVRAIDIDLDGNVDVIFHSRENETVGWLKNEMENGFGEKNLLEVTMGNFGRIQIVDLDADGILDLLLHSRYEDIVFCRNSKNGIEYKNIYSPKNTTHWVLTTDLNLDGQIDIIFNDVYIFDEIYWKKNTGTSSFKKEEFIFQRTPFMEKIIALDFDDDNDKDILVSSDTRDYIAWYANNGLNSFSDVRFINTNAEDIGEIETFDLDDDGDIDILNSLITKKQIVWYENDGFGGISNTHIIADELENLNHLLSFDLDQDGDLDILASTKDITSNTHILYRIENIGGGEFGFPQAIIHIEEETIETIDILDADQDGDMDVLLSMVGNQYFSRIVWHENNGEGAFISEHIIATETNPHIERDIEILDIDNNGSLDITVAPWGKQVAVFKNDGIGNFEAFSSFIDVIEWNNSCRLQSEDIDQDGDLDVIFMKRDLIHYATNDGIGNLEVLWTSDYLYSDFCIEDMDGDLRSDIVFSNILKEEIYFHKNLNGRKVKGISFLDQNQNGIYEKEELPLKGIQFSLSPKEYTILSNENGELEKFVRPDTYQLSPKDHPLWEISSPNLTYSIEVLPIMDEELPIYHFGFKPTRILPRVQPFISHSNPRCSSVMNVWLDVNNTGTTFADGRIELEVSELLNLVEANPSADGEENGILYWSFENLAPSQQAQIHLQYEVPNADFIGEEVFFRANTTVLGAENQVLYSGQDIKTAEILCSYDPNDKLIHTNNLDLENSSIWAGDTLYYTIRFQNTGNAEAFNVSITDTLDTNLDLARFHTIASSHDMRTTLLENRVVKFLFPDIFLPDSTTNEPASHGFVTYGITFKDQLHEGIEVKNTAYIYFDFNPPIITNTTANPITYSLLTDIGAFQKESGVKIYPNPFSEFTTIEILAENPSKYRLKLTDITGREVLEIVDIENKKITLNRGNLKMGIYLYQIWEEESGEIIGSGKLMVED